MHPQATPTPALPPAIISWLDLQAEPIPPRPSSWGDWQYDEKRLVLVYAPDTMLEYEVDVEEITTSAKMLDWIFQVAGKTGATPQMLADLLTALRDLLDPQAHYCSFGRERGPVDARAVLTKP